MKKIASLAAIAVAAAVTATSAQASDIKVSGKVFFDYSVHSSTSNSVTDKTGGGNISRTYISAKKKMSKTWSAKVTLDSSFDKKATGKHNNFFLKKAQLTGKFSDAANIKLGMIGTPWIGHEDKLNKHRHISKSFVDTHKMDSSADAGIGFFGNVMDGMISYDIVTVNGGGYGNTKITDRTDINARIGVKPLKGLSIDLGYRNGHLGKYTAATPDTTTLTQALITYGNHFDALSYRAGANFINNAKPTVTETGTELWVWARQDQFGAYARFETLDNGTVNTLTEKRVVVSADYYAAKGLILSAVYDGTTDKGGKSGVDKSKLGLFSQYKF